MNQLNCQYEQCKDEDCICRILDGPVTIHLEGVPALVLESSCINRIKEIGLTEEQLFKVQKILRFISSLKNSQSKAPTNEDQIQALHKIMESFAVWKDISGNINTNIERR